MIRIILGIIVGFVVWSIVWVGSDRLLTVMSPGWLGKHAAEAERAIASGASMVTDPLIAVINLIRSFITSIIAGYIAALVAGEYQRSTLILGVILLAFGIMVQYMAWNLAPAWYHILFLLFLIPMTILGGRLRRSS